MIKNLSHVKQSANESDTDLAGQRADLVAPDVERAKALEAEDDGREDGQVALGEVQLHQRGQFGELVGQRRRRPAARRGRLRARVRALRARTAGCRKKGRDKRSKHDDVAMGKRNT